MAKTSLLHKVRALYVFQGESMESIARQLGLGPNTVRRWHKKAKAAGDDWEIAREGAVMAAGGTDNLSRAMLGMLSRYIVLFEKALIQAEASEESKTVIELSDRLGKLSDAFLKTINTVKKDAPEIDRVALVQTFMLTLNAYLLREHPELAKAFQAVFGGFTKDLVRVFGKRVVSQAEIQELLARAAPTKEIDAIDPGALSRIREEVFGVPGGGDA
ncbi:MAG: DUF1804 family protein [Magnetococcales bacterium]|nr:DUF1804 family protein [Magnetococcales bacterium]